MTFIDLVLLNGLGSYLGQKAKLSKAVMSMLDETFKEKFEDETNADLPRITLSKGQNLKSAWTLLLLLQDLHSVNMKRGTAFIQVTFAVIGI